MPSDLAGAESRIPACCAICAGGASGASSATSWDTACDKVLLRLQAASIVWATPFSRIPVRGADFRGCANAPPVESSLLGSWPSVGPGAGHDLSSIS